MPAIDDCADSWRDGRLFVALLHCYAPECMPEFFTATAETAFHRIQEAFGVPQLLDAALLAEHADEEAILAYLTEFILAVRARNEMPENKARRQDDIARWTHQDDSTDTPPLSSEGGSESGNMFTRTRTSTYTMQHLKFTVTGTSSGGVDAEEDVVVQLLDRIAQFHTRLHLITPTRSSYRASAAMRSTSSATPDLESCDETDSRWSSTMNENEDTHLLHPLHAADEDVRAYEQNFNAFQVSLHSFSLDEPIALYPLVDQAYQNLLKDVDLVDLQLAAFKRGFSFANLCRSVRSELEGVQLRMVKTTTTSDTDIQDMENHVQHAGNQVVELACTFDDLFSEDAVYATHLDSLATKTTQVRSWVDEVRIWFAEAERIREWITIRSARLEETTVPDPLKEGTETTRADVESLNVAHKELETEIETFNQQDMARLRAHVKALTGASRANKDLSPADPTVIEITLTTLTELDRLMFALRRKSKDLQVLTHRVTWEEEYGKAMGWLSDTDQQVHDFLTSSARWQAEEDDLHDGDQREQLLAKEKLKELVVQKLLMLEHKRSEFDQGQFTTTVDAFRDLDDAVDVDVPQYLEDRQSGCEQHFEDLLKRLAYLREIVEQRLKMMDFLYQAHLLRQDGHLLLDELAEAQATLHADDNDREMTARVQGMHERIVQLVTSTATRIPYPTTDLQVDKDENEIANQTTRDVVSRKRTDMILLGEELDHALEDLRNALLQARSAKQLSQDANRLCEWANDRLRVVRKTSGSDASSRDELIHLEREHETLRNKLQGKENETIDLLTQIEALLETAAERAIFKDALSEASQDLTEAFDSLRDALDEQARELHELRCKMEDGNSHMARVGQLQAFLAETRAALPVLKQTCGFMTGQSEEQDRQRYEMLQQNVARLTSAFSEQSKLLQALPAESPERLTLNKDWDQLGQELGQLATFADTVGEWYDRQRRLSKVENELLVGMNEAIAGLAKKGEWHAEDVAPLEAQLAQARDVLAQTDREIMGANRDDPLETANYSCARDRRASVADKLAACQDNLDALKQNAKSAVALSAFLEETDRLLAGIQDEKECIGQRMTQAGASSFAALEAPQIEGLYRMIMERATTSEQRHATFLAQMQRLARTPGLEPRVVAGAAQRIQASLDQLADTIALEKRQAAFVRKTQIHAKAGSDLQNWITHCDKAIAGLSPDICLTDEVELRNEMEKLEYKMAEMQPTLRAFQAMPPRILTGNLCELSIDGEQVKATIQAREDTIMQAWDALAQRLEQARQSILASRRNVAIARKVKEILTLIGHLKERGKAIKVAGVRPHGSTRTTASRNSHRSEEDDSDFDEEASVRQCALEAMPTEHTLMIARAGLDLLDRDIEQHLHTKQRDLDTLLQHGQRDIFKDQTSEIAAATQGLQSLIQRKRGAVAIAEELETFLTVAEEQEVLLSAVSEVVARAAPENARLVDGVPSRADLQALLIDLDTRYRYYQPKIGDLFDEAREVAQELTKDKRVAACVQAMEAKWAALQAQAEQRRADLLAMIGPLMMEPSPLARKSISKRASMPAFVQPQPSMSTPRPVATQTKRRPKSALAPRPPVMPATRRTGTFPRTTAKTAPPAAAAVVSRASSRTPETYKADPKNDLDVALGDIVNDSPYKIGVKMVPGEVGKYWFGREKPKLAYCRVLRSRMVMVRVGGGWVELSQFLRDHALIEEGKFVPHAHNGSIREGFLRTNGNTSPVTIRGGAGAGKPQRRTPTPQMRESCSTPTNNQKRMSFGHGIKDGDKFLVPVDGQGNQVEVKMRKAKSRETKFIMPGRTRA